MEPKKAIRRHLQQIIKQTKQANNIFFKNQSNVNKTTNKSKGGKHSERKLQPNTATDQQEWRYFLSWPTDQVVGSIFLSFFGNHLVVDGKLDWAVF